MPRHWRGIVVFITGPMVAKRDWQGLTGWSFITFDDAFGRASAQYA
jgi:hypothetical protein